jgi:hypothetical protein
VRGTVEDGHVGVLEYRLQHTCLWRNWSVMSRFRVLKGDNSA